MKRYYISINNVKVELIDCLMLKSLGLFNSEFIIDFSIPFNKNDISVQKYIEGLWNKRSLEGIVRKADVCFDAEVFEGEKCIGKFCAIQPLYRRGQDKWHMIFDFYDKKTMINCDLNTKNFPKIVQTFEIDEIEDKAIKKWQKEIKKKYGKYGNFSYIFTPTGIGNILKVKSELTGETKDFTNIDNW